MSSSKKVIVLNRPRRRRNGGQPSVIRNRFSSFVRQEEKANHIPMFKSNIPVSHTFRFLATSNFNANISTGNVGAVPGVVCYVLNTTGREIIETFKIKRVKIWSPPPSIGGSATCSVEWYSNSTAQLFGSSKEISDTSINVSSPAFISTSPPVGCSASFWQDVVASSTSLFNMVAPAGSIIDLSLDYILLDDANAAAAYTFTSGAATLGTLYYIGLDSSGNKLVPVSKTPNF